MAKNITILGSTGTIGKNTLDVIRNNSDQFKVFALSAKKNLEVLKEQVKEFKPKVVVISDEDVYLKAKKQLPLDVKVLQGVEGLIEVSCDKDVDFVMAGIVGAAGIQPFVAALSEKKMIGLANKESLVMAGEFIAEKFPGFRNYVIPVDSEHSAIFQCLKCGNMNEIRKLILTASGGPFLKCYDFENITVKDALKHPNWKMGKKISIDSATLMNKGFEMIEAFWLFPISIDQIEVIIHPQSIIHSMVEFYDGAIIAHLGIPDMRIPIQYAMSYPNRISNNLSPLNFSQIKNLSFDDPDTKRFPCLDLAFDVIKRANIFPTVLNAANEVTVQSFIDNKIKFTDIAKCNSDVLNKFNNQNVSCLDDILSVDQKARMEAEEWILKKL